MKKKITIILSMLIFTYSFCYALNIYTTSNFEYSFDTNISSDPLPIYDDGPYGNTPGFQWLEHKQHNPFIKKHSLGFNLSLDIFMQDKSRVGLSLALSTKFPIKSTTITPTPENIDLGFAGPWNYKFCNSINMQKISVFGSIGPIFRAQFNTLDLGMSIRLSLGGYDYIDNEVILGIQAEPYLNVFINNNFYISAKLTYDAHFLRLINDETKKFHEFYQMVSLAPSIGLGYKF